MSYVWFSSSSPLLKKYKPKKALKSRLHHSHYWIYSYILIRRFVLPFFFFLNGGRKQISTIQETRPGDTNSSLLACFLWHNSDTQWPGGKHTQGISPATANNKGLGSETVAPLTPRWRSRLCLCPFRLHLLIKWWRRTLTNSKKKNTGDKTACAYTEVINTNTHFCWPERKQSCSYNSDH